MPAAADHAGTWYLSRSEACYFLLPQGLTNAGSFAGGCRWDSLLRRCPWMIELLGSTCVGGGREREFTTRLFHVSRSCSRMLEQCIEEARSRLNALVVVKRANAVSGSGMKLVCGHFCYPPRHDGTPFYDNRMHSHAIVEDINRLNARMHAEAKYTSITRSCRVRERRQHRMTCFYLTSIQHG